MEKGTIDKEILNIHKEKPITWKQVIDSGIMFQADDTIMAGYEEPYYSENNSHDGYYYFQVTRTVPETDEEFERRKKHVEQQKKWAKESRYKTYLKLKEEFENDNG